MRSAQIWRLIRFFFTAGAMYATWLIFTASLQPFSLIAGALGSILIAALTYDEFLAPHEASLNSFIPRPFWLIVYLAYLFWAMYKASFVMLIAVFTGKVNPRIVHFRTRMKSDLGRMVLSNSITFTPGTITLDLNDDHLIVHWFFCDTANSRAAGESVKGRMEGLLRKVWQ
jgi:multicomponent Na+:H+ antiporter subunit E